MVLTIKVPIAMVRNSFGMEASRLSLLDHGPKSNEIRANSRMTAQPEVNIRIDRIGPEKRGGLKGSTQHWPAVYPPEFEIPRFVVAGY